MRLLHICISGRIIQLTLHRDVLTTPFDTPNNTQTVQVFCLTISRNPFFKSFRHLAVQTTNRLGKSLRLAVAVICFRYHCIAPAYKEGKSRDDSTYLVF